MLEGNDLPGRVERDADGIEAQLRRSRSLRRSRCQPQPRHQANLAPLPGTDGGEWPERPRIASYHACLDLTEDEMAIVGGNEV
jgi:hypothetical protein